MVTNYSINSSVHYASTSWRLFGTNDGTTYLVLDNRTGIELNADKEWNSTFTCPTCFKYYYFELEEGFDDDTAFLNITLNISAGAAGPARYIANTTMKYGKEECTPKDFFEIIAIAGVLLLLGSIILPPKYGNDIIGILSMPLLGFAMWQSLSLCRITSYGMAPLSGANGTFVMLENWTVYGEWELTIILLSFWVISIVNLYRLYLQRKVINDGSTERNK